MQLSFPFLKEIPKAGMPPSIDGWPILNYGHPGRGGYQSGWIHRRWYPSAEEALSDARLAIAGARVRLFVIKHIIDKSEVWPEGCYWQISQGAPFSGSMGKSLYIPRPDYYILDPDGMIPEVFVEGGDLCKLK